MTTEEGGQLELFELRHQPAPRPHREPPGRFFISLRHDQIVLTGVGGLLVLTVVFAGGVERGKHLVRAERALLARAPATTPAAHASPVAAEPVSTGPAATTTSVSNAQRKPSPAVSEPKGTVTPPVKTKAPVKVAAKSQRAAPGSASRYAIQVVTYSRPQLAKKELDRLRAKGERAFLVMRDGRTTLYVGPFPSRDNASSKLTMLKPRYHDCFLRVL